MCKIKIGSLCKKSTNETEIYSGSGFCKRCKCFNGVLSTDKTMISCLYGV
jgi:hypothetical protein